jgi:hypothetical protein
MTRCDHIQAEQLAEAEIKSSLLGRKCWYAYTSVGNTPKLVLGRKVPRDAEDLAARAKLAGRRASRGVARHHPDVWERCQGESELLVWCSWRLDDAKGPVTSWDDESQRCEDGICGLIGHSVRNVEIGAGWNLRLDFASGLVLSVLPDHVGPSPSFDGNWELWKPDQAYLIGTDLTCEVIDCENRRLRPQPQKGRWQVKA